ALQDRSGINLEHPRRAANAQPLRQAPDHAHDQVVRHALLVKDRAEGLQKIAVADEAQQLAPMSPIGMAIGAEVAPSHPAPRGTGGAGANVHRSVDLAAAPPRGDDARGWS